MNKFVVVIIFIFSMLLIRAIYLQPVGRFPASEFVDLSICGSSIVKVQSGFNAITGSFKGTNIVRITDDVVYLPPGTYKSTTKKNCYLKIYNGVATEEDRDLSAQIASFCPVNQFLKTCLKNIPSVEKCVLKQPMSSSKLEQDANIISCMRIAKKL